MSFFLLFDKIASGLRGVPLNTSCTDCSSAVYTGAVQCLLFVFLTTFLPGDLRPSEQVPPALFEL
jgi:hypothetical protein